MATLRDILRKIAAVKKTQQITRAMNMVAASKLRNTQERMEHFEPYAEKFADVLGNLTRQTVKTHPLLLTREKISRVELLHFTGDRGLCGSFNMNSITKGEKWLKEQEALYSCPECGGEICVHDEECYDCGKKHNPNKKRGGK